MFIDNFNENFMKKFKDLPKELSTRRVLFIILGMAPTDEIGNKMISKIFNCSEVEANGIKADFVLSLLPELFVIDAM
jgi:hypothetical protein